MFLKERKSLSFEQLCPQLVCQNEVLTEFLCLAPDIQLDLWREHMAYDLTDFHCWIIPDSVFLHIVMLFNLSERSAFATPVGQQT